RARTGSWPCCSASRADGSTCARAAAPWRGGALRDLPCPGRRVGHRRHARTEHAQLAVGVLEGHPEVEPLAAEQLGDLAQCLLADVLDLEQVVLAELDQVLE